VQVNWLGATLDWILELMLVATELEVFTDELLVDGLLLLTTTLDEDTDVP
jgi:hypothetical protein